MPPGDRYAAEVAVIYDNIGPPVIWLDAGPFWNMEGYQYFGTYDNDDILYHEFYHL